MATLASTQCAPRRYSPSKQRWHIDTAAGLITRRWAFIHSSRTCSSGRNTAPVLERLCGPSGSCILDDRWGTIGGGLAFSDAIPRTSREEHETNQRLASRRKVRPTAGRQLDGVGPFRMSGGGILQQRWSLHLAGRTRFPRPLSHPLLLPTRTRLACTETIVTLRSPFCVWTGSGRFFGWCLRRHAAQRRHTSSHHT
jgi:hypothetical protein